MMMGTAVLTGTTSCVSDLDQYPHTETTSKDVYTSLANYEAVLGKIYAAMVTSGQGKGGDNKDMSSVLNNGSGFDYMRMFINMQECGTDEFASTWLTGESKQTMCGRNPAHCCYMGKCAYSPYSEI